MINLSKTRLLSTDIYHLSTRIKATYFYRIKSGDKNVEFRPTSAFWETRCTRAQKFLKAGKEVHLVLLNGDKKLKVQVLAVGKMATGPHFWDHFTLGNVTQDWATDHVWAILMGEILE